MRPLWGSQPLMLDTLPRGSPLAGKLLRPAAWAGALPEPGQALAALRRARPVLADMSRRAVSEHDARRRGLGGAFQPRWPRECHFSREYMDDLLAEVDAELAQRAQRAQQAQHGSAQQQGGDAAAGHPLQDGQAAAAQAPAVDPALLTAGAHAEYAGCGDAARRAALAAQADAMLEGEGGAPALACLPRPSLLRSHWLLRVQLEWEAAAAEPLDLALLARRRSQRRWERALSGRGDRGGGSAGAGASSLPG
jgi:hypothetical protein